ncbi:MAG: hypothetical protein EON56_03880, partial [Alphaproteobacteria bacterium]
MRFLDLNAEILPGHSAAGFELGMHVAEIDAIVSNASVLHRLPTNQELRENAGVLVVRSPPDVVEAVFFGDDQVRLAFNARGRLYCIFLFEGYRGFYRQTIQIGTLLRHANEEHALLFDDGDEMSYIANESGDIVPGIAFCGRSCALEVDPEQPIS